MSEKEKRILILTDTDPIGLCDKAHAFQYDFCPFTGNGKKTCREVCGLGLPRSEAVERMAAAMCMRANRIFDCTDCLTAAKGDCEVRLYHNMAVAALDALIKEI
ncbi:MAG TPA: hypothetical protein IAB21_03500 [Candidatus Avelusimicrobium excrementipullorum]|nr:hypothetical protein [Candidatus Avelusimicrobium excrementipullorum]